MLKNKYQRMNKEEKIKTKKAFKNSERGKSVMPRLDRLIIWGLLGFVVSIGFLTYYQVGDVTATKWDYAYIGMLFLSAVIFLIGSAVLRAKEYNKFAISKKK